MIDPLFTLPGLLKALVILVVIVVLDVTHVLITATQRIGNMDRRKRRGVGAPGGSGSHLHDTGVFDDAPVGTTSHLSPRNGEPGGESGRRFLRFVFMPGRHGASRESPQEGIAPQSRLEEVRYTSCPGVGHGRITLPRGRFVDREGRSTKKLSFSKPEGGDPCRRPSGSAGRLL